MKKLIKVAAAVCLCSVLCLPAFGQVVVGPLTSQTNSIPRFANATGKRLTNSVAFIDSNGNFFINTTNGTINIPPLTSAQRDAMSATNGMVIYNSTTAKVQFREAGAWVDLGTGGSVDESWINVTHDPYNAKGDGHVVTDGILTNATTALFSATAVFTAADVGKLVSVAGAGAAGVSLNTTISAFVSATQVTLGAAASTTVTAAQVKWGTDDSAAIQAATTAATDGNTVYFPQGRYHTKTAGYGTGFTAQNKSNLVFRGEGRSSMIIRSDAARTDATGLFTNCFGITFKTLSFDANNVDRFGGLQLNHCSEVTIRDCYITDSDPSSSWASFDHYAILVQYCSGVRILDNDIEHGQTEYNEVEYLWYQRNKVALSAGTAAFGSIPGSTNSYLRDFWVTDNEFVDSRKHVICISQESFTNGWSVVRGTIARNKISQPTIARTGHGIGFVRLGGVAGDTSGNVFEDNLIEDNIFWVTNTLTLSAQDIHFNHTQTGVVHNRTTIRGNKNLSTVAGEWVYDFRKLTNSSITGNEIKSAAYGMSVTASDTVTIDSGNKVTAPTSAYNLSSSSGNSVLEGQVIGASVTPYSLSGNTSTDRVTRYESATLSSWSDGDGAVKTVRARGTGSPEGVVTAPVSSVFHRTDGGSGTSIYIKESGAGNTGWVAVVPAGGGSATNAYNLILEDDTPLTGRLALNFVGTSLTAQDNGASTRTDVISDADLDDLADGSLTGSKVGTGINADNLTTGTIDEARLATLDFAKVTAGINNNNLTNGNLFLSASVKELQDYSESTTPSWDLDGKRAQFLKLVGNTTMSIANIPAAGSTNALEWWSHNITNSGTFTFALTVPGVARWMNSAPPSVFSSLKIFAEWVGYELQLSWTGVGASITFPATQVASTNVNTLDDYEEGPWTPTDASGAGLSFTIVAADCSYIKVGKQVTASFRLVYPSTANGAGATVGSLPFQAANSDGMGGFLSYNGAAMVLNLGVSSGNTTFALFKTGGAQAANSELSTVDLRGTVIYQATQ